MKRVLAALAASLTIACVAIDQPTQQDQVAAQVVGQIRRENGAGVGNATVNLLLTSLLDSTGTGTPYSSFTVVSSDSGQFSATFIINKQTSTDALISIRVNAPLGSGLLTKDTLAIPVKLNDQFPPRDTTFVFIVMSPRPS